MSVPQGHLMSVQIRKRKVRMWLASLCSVELISNRGPSLVNWHSKLVENLQNIQLFLSYYIQLGIEKCFLKNNMPIKPNTKVQSFSNVCTLFRSYRISVTATGSKFIAFIGSNKFCSGFQSSRTQGPLKKSFEGNRRRGFMQNAVSTQAPEYDSNVRLPSSSAYVQIIFNFNWQIHVKWHIIRKII